MGVVLGLVVTANGADGAFATRAEALFGRSTLPVGGVYLQTNTSWASGMTDTPYIDRAAACATLFVSVPMLIGPPSGPAVERSGTGRTLSPESPDGTPVATPMTLADVAGGAWDVPFSRTFESIASSRPDAILRIGWELYGSGWYPWSGPALAAEHVAAYRRLVTLARATSAAFRFDWNGGLVLGGYDPMISAYPGDDYADFVSADIFDVYPPGGAAGWRIARSVLGAGLDFARSHDKLFNIPEFGMFKPDAFGDDPDWMAACLEWMSSTPGLGYALCFDDLAGSLTLYPRTAAVLGSVGKPIVGANLPAGPSGRHSHEAL